MTNGQPATDPGEPSGQRLVDAGPPRAGRHPVASPGGPTGPANDEPGRPLAGDVAATDGTVPSVTAPAGEDPSDEPAATSAPSRALRRRVAAVDVGTNSTRLLVLDHDGSPIVRVQQVTRLGLGMDANGRFDDAALARTLAVLRRYAATWEAHDVEPDDVRIAATSAARDAADRDRFFEGVVAATGVPAEVLSGADEATLSFAGATAGREPDGRPVLVVDVGGGSTELVAGVDGYVRASTSLQLGTVRLTERLLPHDPPTVEQVAEATAEVHARLDEAAEVLDAVGHDGAPTVIGVAGTATTLGAMHLGLSAWTDGAVHGTAVSQRALDRLATRLLALPAARRHEVGLLQPGREDVIAAGALILRAVLDRIDADALVVSEADILDGLAASLRP